MALPTSTWVPVNWTDGEIMTELKLDSQQGNAIYLRDRSRNRVPGTCGALSFNEWNIAATHDELSQARVVIADDSGHEVPLPPVFLKPPGGTASAPEEWWTPVDAKNVAWGGSLGTNETLSARWEWRVNEAAGWSTAGTEEVVGVLTSNEANDYLSVWAEVLVNMTSRRIESPVAGWIRTHLRGLVIVGGRLNEGF